MTRIQGGRLLLGARGYWQTPDAKDLAYHQGILGRRHPTLYSKDLIRFYLVYVMVFLQIPHQGELLIQIQINLQGKQIYPFEYRLVARVLVGPQDLAELFARSVTSQVTQHQYTEINQKQLHLIKAIYFSSQLSSGASDVFLSKLFSELAPPNKQ